MNIYDLGFNNNLNEYLEKEGFNDFTIGRVSQEHRDRYTVISEEGELDCELIGSLRFGAENRSDLPAVGDWIAAQIYDEGKAIIHKVLPRKSSLTRKANKKRQEEQFIATNVDFGVIVQSLNRDFNLNRIERYFSICHASKIEPIVVLTKTDLIDPTELDQLKKSIAERIKNVPFFTLSNLDRESLNDFENSLKSGFTYCFLGSSGVGKSTLINHLLSDELLKTQAISESIDRGKHTTTYRHLIALKGGAIVIDNPGIREVGITSNSEGIESTFNTITDLAMECKFSDCSHTTESGCRVLDAVHNGELDESALNNYNKLERERQRIESSEHELRQKDRAFGKMVKEAVKKKKV